MNIKAALTKKYAGVPGFAWAGLAAIAAYFILPKFLKAGSSSATSDTSSSDPSASSRQPGYYYADSSTGSQGIGYQSGYQAGYSAGSAAAPPAPAPAPAPGPELLAPRPAVTADTGAAPPPSRGVAQVGGPSVGSRSADPWEDHHPHLRRSVIYPHYVRVGGGPAVGGSREAHVARVSAVARQVGVHPARLLALNPDHRARVIRVA